jgi:hypothetical protein
MAEWLRTAFGEAPDVPMDVVLLRLVGAFAMGGIVALVYAASHKRDAVGQPGFLTTLVLLSILIAAVTQVIGNNVARAFSLVGALAIVRFRTVVADTRDTAFVIFAVVVGMAAGAGQIAVAASALAVGSAAAFAVRPRGARAAEPWRLTVRLGIDRAPSSIDPILARFCASRELRATATTRQGASLDLVFDVRLLDKVAPSAFVSELNAAEGVQQVDLARP